MLGRPVGPSVPGRHDECKALYVARRVAAQLARAGQRAMSEGPLNELRRCATRGAPLGPQEVSPIRPRRVKGENVPVGGRVGMD